MADIPARPDSGLGMDGDEPSLLDGRFANTAGNQAVFPRPKKNRHKRVRFLQYTKPNGNIITDKKNYIPTGLVNEKPLKQEELHFLAKTGYYLSNQHQINTNEEVIKTNPLVEAPFKQAQEKKLEPRIKNNLAPAEKLRQATAKKVVRVKDFILDVQQQQLLAKKQQRLQQREEEMFTIKGKFSPRHGVYSGYSPRQLHQFSETSTNHNEGQVVIKRPETQVPSNRPEKSQYNQWFSQSVKIITPQLPIGKFNQSQYDTASSPRYDNNTTTRPVTQFPTNRVKMQHQGNFLNQKDSYDHIRRPVTQLPTERLEKQQWEFRHLNQRPTSKNSSASGALKKGRLLPMELIRQPEGQPDITKCVGIVSRGRNLNLRNGMTNSADYTRPKHQPSLAIYNRLRIQQFDLLTDNSSNKE
ncbi:hypothetical protein TrispH2_002616 [Trichoplax sp. H2]|nr:hypothetical protein TrispH2_002616 [Trichoplax sp. H2]|eukprot:RDD45402.1 hypothetical protein TrispH2_002616 [Trichoplax sp. H2]